MTLLRPYPQLNGTNQIEEALAKIRASQRKLEAWLMITAFSAVVCWVTALVNLWAIWSR